MSWLTIEGHDQTAEKFARAFARGRLEGSYLFVGPEGIGKRSFAFQLAKTLLCQRVAELENTGEIPFSRFVPCGVCDSCRLFEPGAEIEEEPVPKKKKKKAAASSDTFTIPSHPDFYFVNRPPDRSLIPVELLIGAKEERMRAGLCFDLSRSPYFGGRKIAVIDDADFLNQEGANALLKTLEEPPRKSLLILIGTAEARQLPTIRSRCRTIRFSPLTATALAQILVQQKAVPTLEEGLARAGAADGSVTAARLFDDPALSEFRAELFRHLFAALPEPVPFAQRMAQFVDDAGKEASARRLRLKTILVWGAEYFRDLIRTLSGGTPLSRNASDIRRAADRWPASVQAAERCCDQTLLALEQIDRNANVPVIVESWLYQLDRIIHQ